MRYRTEEEIAKASSDPDYGKNTGIGNYTGFPIYGDGAVDEMVILTHLLRENL